MLKLFLIHNIYLYKRYGFTSDLKLDLKFVRRKEIRSFELCCPFLSVMQFTYILRYDDAYRIGKNRFQRVYYWVKKNCYLYYTILTFVVVVWLNSYIFYFMNVYHFVCDVLSVDSFKIISCILKYCACTTYVLTIFIRLISCLQCVEGNVVVQ